MVVRRFSAALAVRFFGAGFHPAALPAPADTATQSDGPHLPAVGECRVTVVGGYRRESNTRYYHTAL